MEKLWLTGICLLIIKGASSEINLEYSCGTHVNPETVTSGVISTPNYPGNYPNYAHCIWLLEAPKKHAMKVTFVDGMHGEEIGGSCRDYIEIRNGSKTSELLFTGCTPTPEEVILTSNRWMWIKFYSDESTSYSGFSLNWELVSDESVSDESPLDACPAVNFRCANQQCVYEAYRCDGWNDCGCLGGGCDEDDCAGLTDWTERNRVALGVGIGSSVFCIIFFGIGILEIYLKRRAEIKEKKYNEESKRRAKQQRAAAKAKESDNLAVPGGDLNNSMNSSGTATSAPAPEKTEKKTS